MTTRPEPSIEQLKTFKALIDTVFADYTWEERAKLKRIVDEEIAKQDPFFGLTEEDVYVPDR